jgi:hypothetical protein
VSFEAASGIRDFKGDSNPQASNLTRSFRKTSSETSFSKDDVRHSYYDIDKPLVSDIMKLKFKTTVSFLL